MDFCRIYHNAIAIHYRLSGNLSFTNETQKINTLYKNDDNLTRQLDQTT